jgi:RsiW-degrading membrane proteinase PrsW (M82 family)
MHEELSVSLVGRLRWLLSLVVLVVIVVVVVAWCAQMSPSHVPNRPSSIIVEQWKSKGRSEVQSLGLVVWPKI